MLRGDAQLPEVPAPTSLACRGGEDLDDRALHVEPALLEPIQHEAARPAEVTEQGKIEELARLAACGELRGERVLCLEGAPEFSLHQALDAAEGFLGKLSTKGLLHALVCADEICPGDPSAHGHAPEPAHVVAEDRAVSRLESGGERLEARRDGLAPGLEALVTVSLGGLGDSLEEQSGRQTASPRLEERTISAVNAAARVMGRRSDGRFDRASRAPTGAIRLVGTAWLRPADTSLAVRKRIGKPRRTRWRAPSQILLRLAFPSHPGGSRTRRRVARRWPRGRRRVEASRGASPASP